MDREAVAEKLKVLKSKAREARRAGKKEAAAVFRSGMKRLQRRLKASTPWTRRTRGKKED